MASVLVIGAAGYVGEGVCLELRRKGHEVYGLVRNIAKADNLIKGEVNVIVGDAAKKETYAELVKKVDVVIYSTYDMSNPSMDPNFIEGLDFALENFGGGKKKIIFVSGSLACYPSDVPQTEDSPTLSKETTEQFPPELSVAGTFVANRLSAEKKIVGSKKYAGVVARAPNIYGGWWAHPSFYFKHAEEGKLSIFGDGTTIHSYIHVDDFVAGLVKLVNADVTLVEGQIFNFAEFDRITVKEQAKVLVKATGRDLKDLKEEYLPFSFLWGRGSVIVDSSKANRVLGWTPVHNLVRDAPLLYKSWKAWGEPMRWTGY